MRRPPARALLFSLALGACSVEARPHGGSENPSLVPAPPQRPPAISSPDPWVSIDDQEASDEPVPATAHIDGGSERDGPNAPLREQNDASAATISDAGAPIMETTPANEGHTLATNAGRDAGPDQPCQGGVRKLTTLTVNARVDNTVLLDARSIYFQNALPTTDYEPRDDLLSLSRTAPYGGNSQALPVTVLHDDFALAALVDGGDGYLYFVGMRQGDDDNQGLFRALKRERVGIESVPVHAQSSDDYWPGQLAADKDAFYLASIGPDSHSLRLVRSARANHQREELWRSTDASNDSDALGALTLRGGDIALDAQHVYFTLGVNRGQAAPEFHVYRLDKQGSAQTPQLLTTIRSRYGGLASNGSHLFFSHDGQLEQYDLASGARVQLVAQEGMRDLSYADGVLSWAPGSGAPAGTLAFFCL